MPTTWNPADLISVTLSGGNLVATANAEDRSRRVPVVSDTSREVYLEYSNLASAGGGGFGARVPVDHVSGNAGGPIGIFTGGASMFVDRWRDVRVSVLSATIGLAVISTRCAHGDDSMVPTLLGGMAACLGPVAGYNGAQLTGSLPGSCIRSARCSTLRVPAH